MFRLIREESEDVLGVETSDDCKFLSNSYEQSLNVLKRNGKASITRLNVALGPE